MFITPYKLGSRTVIALADALDLKVLSPERLLTKRSSKVINFGNSQLANVNTNHEILNKNTSKALNKFDCSTYLLNAGVDVPYFTSETEEAQDWIDDGGTVVARKFVKSREGRGIEIYSGDVWLPEEYPMYTQYVKNRREFRVHAFKDEIIDITEKRPSFREYWKVNFEIRSHANGWVFSRSELKIPNEETLQEISNKTLETLDLDFAAIDFIYDVNAEKWLVLEVNTAPGLEETSLEKYITKFKSILYGDDILTSDNC